MKTITAEWRRRLENFPAGDRLNLPTAITGKDIHVTELLKGLSGRMVAHDGFRILDKRLGLTRCDAEIVIVSQEMRVFRCRPLCSLAPFFENTWSSPTRR
jgi:hypothetical protein